MTYDSRTVKLDYVLNAYNRAISEGIPLTHFGIYSEQLQHSLRNHQTHAADGTLARTSVDPRRVPPGSISEVVLDALQQEAQIWNGAGDMGVMVVSLSQYRPPE